MSEGKSPAGLSPLRRRPKEWRERIAALVLVIPLAPVFAACAIAIKLEGLIDPDARGPIFFRESRISRGRVIGLLKFRTLTATTIASLGEGPTHIKLLENKGNLTGTGRVMKKWYLDELPQLLNIVRGDFFLIGTRPYPLQPYEDELAKGITRKRDMPAGLIGPAQASKGDRSADSDVKLDAEYWAAFQDLSGLQLLLLDLRIVARSVRVVLKHKGL